MRQFDPSNALENYLVEQAINKKIPLNGTFELLPLCNMNCKMCYIRITKEEQEKQGNIMSSQEWLRIAEEASKLGTLFILLTGGEPLLHPEFKEIYKGIIGMGIYVTINTNGTLINEEIANLFAEYPPRRINITLYGTSDETYGRLCGNSNGFSQVMNGIQLLKDRNIQIKLNATIGKENYCDFDGITALADSLRLPIEIPFYLFPKNRKDCKNNDDNRLSPKEAAKLRFDIVRHSFSNDLDKTKEDAMKTLQNIENMTREGMIVPKGFWCASGVKSFWVNWKGNVTSCGMLEDPCFNVKNMSFDELWKNLLESTNQFELSKECFYCKYQLVCGTCAANMKAETGKFNGVPKYVCETMKEYESILKEFVGE